jgi:hypothetical protein
MTPGTWKALPQGNFLPAADKLSLSRWLATLALEPELWSQVGAIRQIPSGEMELTLKTGAQVIWGPLDNGTVQHKAQTLTRILDDAHHHLGGAAFADLRFFDQGRIIVRPKGRL